MWRRHGFFPAWLMFLVFAASGAWAQPRTVALDPKPFLDKPAQITVHHAGSQAGTDGVGLVVLNFPGQSLKASGDLLDRGRSLGTSTLRKFLGTLQVSWGFDFFEVRSSSGETLGYLLVHPDVVSGFVIFEEEGHIQAQGQYWGTGGGGE